MSGTSEQDLSKRLAVLGACLHALGLAILLSGSAAGYFLAIRPLEERISQCERRRAELEGLLQEADQVRQAHARLSQAVAAMEAKAALLQQRVPEEPMEAEFLSHLAQAASRVGLRVRDYRPGGVRLNEACSQIEIQLSGDGSYRSLCELLDRLAAMPRLNRVQAMQITAGTSGTCSINLSLLVYFRLARSPSGQPEVKPASGPAPGQAANAVPGLPLARQKGQVHG